MFSYQLSKNFLSIEEQRIFDQYLIHKNLEPNIWQVFDSLFKSKVDNGIPLVLKIFENNSLCGAVILTQCKGYGKALFDNNLLSGLVDLMGIPYVQWIKFGCCMDMMSNEGFIKNPNDSDKVLKSAINYLKENFHLTIVTDYSENVSLYGNASILPALPHAIIDCSGMNSIQDYTKNYKNLNRKLKVFENKGGRFILQERMLDTEQLKFLKKCFISTAEKSIFYLPYQDLYLNAALTTSNTDIDKVFYFIATLNGEFIGYQAAIKTGKYLNALHGAFDRNLKTNYHAYDILFVKMTEFAIENGLEICDFGAVLNFTKQKMINKTKEMSYFVLSKYSIIQRIFNLFLKITKVQSKKQLKFR